MNLSLMDGEADFGNLLQSHYAIDLASVHSLIRFSASNERRINIEACAEFGILGPSASGTLQSPEVSLYGLTFSIDLALRGGIGVKVAKGGGLTLDITRPKLRCYVKSGFYTGIGGEGELKVNVGIDPEADRIFSENFAYLSNSSVYKPTLSNLQRWQEETNSEQPTTALSRFWKEYKQESIQDCKTDVIESMAQAARPVGFFAIRKQNDNGITQGNTLPKHNLSKLANKIF